jgi:hypothetical protein
MDVAQAAIDSPRRLTMSIISILAMATIVMILMQGMFGES